MRAILRLVLVLLFLPNALQGRTFDCGHSLAGLLAEYDLVVVGSGAGGAITASRFAQAGKKVAVMEAGAPGLPIQSKVPAFHAAASETPAVALDYGAAHYADPQRAQADPKYDTSLGGVLYPRGEGIGGSTNVNAMITRLAHKGDWDKIAEITGDPSWGDEAMHAYWVKKIERNLHRPILRFLHWLGELFNLKFLQNLGGHGFSKNNWLKVSQPGVGVLARILFGDSQLRKIIFAAEKKMRKKAPSLSGYLRRALSFFDPNDAKAVASGEEGLTITPMAIDENGTRNGPRNLLLETQARYPDNLHIVTNAVVSRIILDDKQRATGVEILHGKNLLRADDEPAGPVKASLSIKARDGVVVCAGAFETPKLLKLSGIGPRDELGAHGIAVRVHSPHVGENLHDRYEVPIISRARRPFQILRNANFRPDESDPEFRKWLRGGASLYGTNGIVIAMQVKSDPSQESPDLYIFGVPGSFPGYYQNYSADATREKDIFTWLVLKAKTANRGGRVLLASNDPRDAPNINFHYFGEGKDSEGRPLSESEDARALAKAVELIRDLNKSMGNLMVEELTPGPGVQTTAQIEEWARRVAWGHHATGTSAIGKVVDNRLRVIGANNLWVVDASIFPHIPGDFIVGPTYQAAEKGADMILEDISRTTGN